MENKMGLDVVIIPEGKGKSKIYSIYAVQIPNVVTQGETIEEAKRMLKEALELYFEDMPQEREELIISEAENNTPLISRVML